MKSKILGLRAVGLLAFGVFAIAPAFAAITTYNGADPAVAVSGPFPNSSTAQSAFLTGASGFGAVATETFEGQTVGSGSPLSLAGGATLSTASGSYSPPFSGVNNTTLGTNYGFNVTPTGSNWFGFPGGAPVADIGFSGLSNSFGIWFTGVQTEVWSSAIQVDQVGGTGQSFLLTPINAGGTYFFGFTDTSAFSGVRISFLAQVVNGFVDAWGIDDISYNVVPEPGTLALLGLGLTGLALSRKRKAA